MPHEAGTYLGGIRDLETLHARCRIDPDTGCWHLLDSRGQALRQKVGEVPAIHVHGFGRRSARRAAIELGAGSPLPRGATVGICDRSWDCVRPAHLPVFATRKQHGEHLAASGRARTLARVSGGRRGARNRPGAKLTAELAQWVRESPQSQMEVAYAVGIGQSTVSEIRLGRLWSDAPVASVFALAARTRLKGAA